MHDVPQFDLYGTLGVSPTATRDDIEIAFRTAAKRHHPDTSTEPAGATERMQRLNVARDWLTDPDRRRRYDHQRGVGRAHAAVADIDPLGDWPGSRAAAPSDGAASPSLMPVIALIALMALLGTVTIGIGSNVVTIAVFALAVTVFAFAGLMAVLSWLR